VKTVTPDGGTVKTVTITNNGNITREQITAAVEKLEGLSIPLQGGRYLAASGIYEYKTGDDKILKVEIKKADATVAALRLILGQLAAAKKVRARARWWQHEMFCESGNWQAAKQSDKGLQSSMTLSCKAVWLVKTE
jgi:hypothetical protein